MTDKKKINDIVPKHNICTPHTNTSLTHPETKKKPPTQKVKCA